MFSRHLVIPPHLIFILFFWLWGISHTERSEEPSVLAARVTLLQCLLHSLLGLLTLSDLGESLVGHNTLQTLQFERVTGGHQVVVVDDLDEWLHLAALCLAGLGHAAGDLLRVSLDAGDEGVREGVGLATVVLRLDDDNLLSCVASTGDDGLWKGGRVSMGFCEPEGVLFRCSLYSDRTRTGRRTTRPTLRTVALSVYSRSPCLGVCVDSHFILLAVLLVQFLVVASLTQRC